jgi:transglutaminase-like putative cysteine protease
VKRYVITHNTRYEYESPVLHAHHSARVRLRTTPFQRVLDCLVSIEPEPASHLVTLDFFQNGADFFELLERHDVLSLSARSTVEVGDGIPDAADLPSTPPWRTVSEHLKSPAGCGTAGEYCYDSPLVRVHATLRDYALGSFRPGRPLLEAAADLNQRIFTDFAYDQTATDVSTPLADVLRSRRGVCQDFAHVAIGCLRSVGLAARYVSGYIETIPPEGMTRLVGADASHAWFGVFVPDHGFVDFDPTNGMLLSDRHVTAAVGRDFSDVSPLKGVVLGGGQQQLSVGVDVEPVVAPAA